MSFAEIQAELVKLTVEDKLRVIEALWNDLCRREESVPVPQWHKELLDERERLIANGKAQFTDWVTVKKRLSDQTS